MLTNLVPLPYRVLALILLAVALVGFGWVKGATHVQSEWDLANSRQAAKVAVVRQKQAEAAVQVVTKYVDRVKVLNETGDAIIKEVPNYVPFDTCVLPGGFRVLHDAAARGELSAAPGAADAPPVAAQTVAATVAGNYESCRANAEQLTALQEWVRAQWEAAASQ